MNLWVPHPSTIEPFQDMGRGDLGTLDDRTTRAGRYCLPDTRFVVTGFMMRFGNAEKVTTYQASAATGDATLKLYNDTRDAPNYDSLDSGTNELLIGVFQLDEWDSVGVDGVDWIAQTFDPHRFTTDLLFYPGDRAVFTWTNPETSGDMAWCMRVLLAPVPNDASL